MPSERNYYVLCDDNCRFPSMTKEQILSAIRQAVEGGRIDVDAGLVTKIREINNDANIQFWVGTQAEYNALSELQDNVLYIISDDTFKEELISQIESLQNTVASLDDSVDSALSSLDELDGRITVIENDTASMQATLDQIETDVSDLEDDREEIMQVIEEQVSEIGRLDAVYNGIKGIAQRIEMGTETTLYSGNITIESQSIPLTGSTEYWSRIYIRFDHNGTKSEEMIYPNLLGEDHFIFQYWTDSDIEYIEMHLESHALVIDGSTAPEHTVNLTVSGVI